jgi:hypothetical protein
MTHRPEQTVTAAKIIHTTVHLCLTSCFVLVIVCVDRVRYTVEQLVFLYEMYLKCGSTGKCWRKFCRKFPGITVPCTTGIHKLILKSQVYWVTSGQETC